MTLALILLWSACWPAPALPMLVASAPQSASADKPAGAAAVQEQPTTPEQKPATTSKPSTAPSQTSTSQTRPPAKRPHHKKKPVAQNCDSAPAAAGTADSGSTPSTVAPGSTSAETAQDSKAPTAPANCPPQRVIVRHGGTSEPSIQLAGGATGNQASGQRDTANRMLDATEENLKKLAGRQLSSSQQDMVSQIHDFVRQSRMAVVDGDLDRARNLAWKAQTLSEELVKPAQ